MIPIQTSFVDRDRELHFLQEQLDRVLAGNGRFVLLEGEAGIGKTRLIEELRIRSSEPDLLFCYGKCLFHEYTDPYLPFIDAIKSCLHRGAATGEARSADRAGKPTPEHTAGRENATAGAGRPGGAAGTDEPSFAGATAAHDADDESEPVSGAATADEEEPNELLPFSLSLIPIQNEKNASSQRHTPTPPRGELEEDDEEILEKLLPLGLIPMHSDATIATEAAQHDGAAYMAPRTRSPGELDIDIDIDIDVEKEQEELFDAIYRMILGMSERRPTILFLDDLQWADNASLRLLQYIARKTSKLRLLLIGSYRPEDLIASDTGTTNQLKDTLQRMNRERLFTRLKLERFDLSTTTKMLEVIFDRTDLSPRFCEMIYRRSEGNPFFIEEIVRTLLEEGVIDLRSRRWPQQIDLRKFRMPQTVEAVISRRVQRLSSTNRKVLRYAAMIGREFDFELLCESVNMDEERLIDTIEELIAMRLVREIENSTQERYRFNNVLTQELIQKAMSRSRRRVIHRKIAHAMVSLDEGELVARHTLADLAFHYYKGKQFEAALPYLIRAAEHAISVFALDNALKFDGLALKILKRLPPSKERREQRRTLLKQLGNVSFLAADWELCLQHFQALLALAKELDNSDDIALAYRHIGDVYRAKGDWADANTYYRKALPIYDRIAQNDGLSETHRGLGYVHWREGDYDDARHHYKIAVEHAKRAENEKLLASIFIELGNVFADMGDLDESATYYRDAIESLERQDDLVELSRVYNNLGDLCLQQEEFEEALHYFQRSLELAGKTHNYQMLGYAQLNIGETRAKLGQLDRAVDNLEKAKQIFERIDDQLGIAGVFMDFGLVYSAKKEWGLASNFFCESIELWEELNVPYYQAKSYYEYGKMLEDEGELHEAEQKYVLAKHLLKEIGAKADLENVEQRLAAVRRTTDGTIDN